MEKHNKHKTPQLLGSLQLYFLRSVFEVVKVGGNGCNVLKNFFILAEIFEKVHSLSHTSKCLSFRTPATKKKRGESRTTLSFIVVHRKSRPQFCFFIVCPADRQASQLAPSPLIWQIKFGDLGKYRLTTFFSVPGARSSIFGYTEPTEWDVELYQLVFIWAAGSFFYVLSIPALSAGAVEYTNSISAEV